MSVVHPHAGVGQSYESLHVIIYSANSLLVFPMC